MNDLSSRSHTILRLHIESKPVTSAEETVIDQDNCESSDVTQMSSVRFAASLLPASPTAAVRKPKVKVAQSLLSFVDLAGSER